MAARYYVNREGKVVGDGDESAAQLIYVDGQELDDSRLAEFGEEVPKQLRAMLKKAAAADEPEEPREAAESKEVERVEAEDKARPGPRANR